MRKFAVDIIRPNLAQQPSASESASVTCPVYGRAPLRPFLDMICRTRHLLFSYPVCSLLFLTALHSPELVQVQQGKRDYSVYVLDPLEARSSIPNLPGSSGSSAHGLATGLGLMSVALSDPECDFSVTGTINNDGIQEERLEVIFALREVSTALSVSLYNALIYFAALVHWSGSPTTRVRSRSQQQQDSAHEAACIVIVRPRQVSQ